MRMQLDETAVAVAQRTAKTGHELDAARTLTIFGPMSLLSVMACGERYKSYFDPVKVEAFLARGLTDSAENQTSKDAQHVRPMD